MVCICQELINTGLCSVSLNELWKAVSYSSTEVAGEKGHGEKGLYTLWAHWHFSIIYAAEPYRGKPCPTKNTLWFSAS